MAPYDITRAQDDLDENEPDEFVARAVEDQPEEMSLADSLQTVFAMFRAPHG